jgi:hypothetical protein
MTSWFMPFSFAGQSVPLFLTSVGEIAHFAMPVERRRPDLTPPV